MFGILVAVKGEKDPAPRIPNYCRVLIFLFQIADRKGWIQQSSPWSSYCSRFLNSGFTVPHPNMSLPQSGQSIGMGPRGEDWEGFVNHSQNMQLK